MKINLKLSLIILLLFSFGITNAQKSKKDKKEETEIFMKNGNIYLGEIVSKNKKTITIRTRNGSKKIKRNDIDRIQEYYQGKFSFSNPNKSNYLISGSNIPHDKATGYFQSVFFIINKFQYGVTDNFSIGGGLEVSSLFTKNPTWWITPSVSYQVKDKVYLGGESLLFAYGNNLLSLNYGKGTYGTKDTNITLGLGYGANLKDFNENSPSFMVSGTWRIASWAALVSENYFQTSDLFVKRVNLHALRFLSRRFSLDIGRSEVIDKNGTRLPLIYMGAVYQFLH